MYVIIINTSHLATTDQKQCGETRYLSFGGGGTERTQVGNGARLALQAVFLTIPDPSHMLVQRQRAVPIPCHQSIGMTTIYERTASGQRLHPFAS